MKSAALLIALKELKSNFRAKRGIVNILVFSTVLSAFSLLFIGDAELSLLDEAEIIYMLAGTITAVGAVVAIIIGVDSFAGENERSTLLPLIISPVKKLELIEGKAIGIAVTWFCLYLISLPYIWAMGSTGQNLLSACVGLGLFGTPVVLGFGLLGMAISLRSGSVIHSLVSTLVIFAVSVSPLFLSMSLRKSVIGKVIDAVNPFACALNTLDSMIIDSENFTVQGTRFMTVIVFAAAMFFLSARNAKNMKWRK